MDEFGTIHNYYIIEKKNHKRYTKGNELLYSFLRHSSVNPYKCRSFLKGDCVNNPKKLPSLNAVNRRLKKLSKIGIIAFDKQGSRKSKCYTLTDYGLYYIIKNHLHRENGEILTQYEDNYVVETLLFSYFGLEFIDKIRDRTIIKEIFVYLQSCCFSIDKLIRELQDVDQNKSYMETVYSKDSLVTYEPHQKNISLVNAIRLISSNKPYNPDLLDTLEKLSLEEINNIKKTNTNEYNHVCEYLKEILKDNKHWFKFELKKHRSLLCNRIVEHAYSGYTLSKKDKNEKERAVESLKEDSKFLELVRSIKTSLDTYFNNFMQTC